MFKKIYVEITNNCNLNCSFCTHNKRKSKYISKSEFLIILEKLKNHTKHLYLHVLGEPLMHPDIMDLINLASVNYEVNITTNGYLIEKIKDCKNIRQINISLHSYSADMKLSLDEYLTKIFNIAAEISRNTYINYRIWVKNKYSKQILDNINKEYNTNLNLDTLKSNNILRDNIFLSTHKEFTWPKLTSNKINNKGTCYALRDHIAILVDGTVVPCCLDADGIIRLGNIFDDTLEDIISSSRYQEMQASFKNNKKCEQLCQRCTFIEK